ncbi:GFA family protein [Vibrio breoganii]|uniref:GFA family protein n=1 Tax=Vibrio breoganii TaxID=553239 RepID=UPI000C837ED1|nr:GFA family protein [Vibrio breoganii]PMK28489.1 aldehyde-activating protein [Vibrio breoganii]PML11184.1 aldehyde-activating protein [Vibrio breoganii]
MQKVRTASCSCGQVEIIARGNPIRSALCHCVSCQKRTGSVFGVQVRFLLEQVTINGDLNQFTRIADSNNSVNHSFCPACGTTMLLSLSIAREYAIIPMGVFDVQDFPPPSFSVYEERKHDWVQFSQQMKHFL